MNKKNTFLVNVLFYLLICSIFLWMNWHLIAAPITPSGDLAADMLLTNRIRDEGWLLVGHYSRYDFNHLGPCWFYYNYSIEHLLKWTSLSRSQLWLAGSIFINAFAVLFSSLTLPPYFLRRKNIYYSLTIALILIGLIGGVLTNLWMPNRLIGPYLMLMVCLLHISSGNYKFLSLAVLLCAMLIHGYITMPMFTLPFLVLASIVGYSKAKINFSEIKRQVKYSIVITAIFIAPLLLDVIMDHPSNLSRILHVKTSLAVIPSRTWLEMFSFINSFLLKKKLILWLFIFQATFIYLIVASHEQAVKKRILNAYIMCAVITLTLIFCYKNTPTPIYPYMAQFYISVPVFFIISTLSIGFSSFSPVNEKKPKKFQIGVVILTIIFIFCILHKAGKPKRNDEIAIQDVSNALIKENKDKQIIAIGFSDYELWPFIGGILLELDRQHIKACTTVNVMLILYTKKEICSADMLPKYLIMPSKKCNNRCFSKSHGLGVSLY